MLHKVTNLICIYFWGHFACIMCAYVCVNSNIFVICTIINECLILYFQSCLINFYYFSQIASFKLNIISAIKCQICHFLYLKVCTSCIILNFSSLAFMEEYYRVCYIPCKRASLISYDLIFILKAINTKCSLQSFLQKSSTRWIYRGIKFTDT